METIVRLDNVSKCFKKGKYVIKNLSLDVHEGEFITLLGSSGCGKTTILRMISGLEEVTAGKVYIDGKDVTEVPAAKREVNNFFQNFALFPHMTVSENVGFGLRMKKEKEDVIEKEVKKALKLVELQGFEDRYPEQLSGGQQQRVAIARGIVMHPKVLLLDESLCSLDLKLKRMMQIELKKLQKKLGLTFIYVTHDQNEALTMSDRIVIIEKGSIEQDGTPQDIYMNPKSVFTADFIGESNIIKGEISSVKQNTIHVKIKDGVVFILDKKEEDKIDDKISIMIRPENIKVSKNKLSKSISGKITDLVYDGNIMKLFVCVYNDLILKVTVKGDEDYKVDDNVYLKIGNEDIIPIRERKNEKSR